MYLTCITVDDDVHGLETLRDFIPNIQKLKLLNEFSCPIKALDFISLSNKIDILFVDIEMPSLSGIDLLEIVKHKFTSVVFTTAHLKYIIDSYELDADGFLLKPFTYTKFERIIKSLPCYLAKKNLNRLESEDYFFVKVKGGNREVIKIKFIDIIAIEGIRNCILIHTPHQSISTYLTIIKIKQILAAIRTIVQVHRSFLISLNHVLEMKNNVITMQRNIKIPIGPKYKDKLFESLKKNRIR